MDETYYLKIFQEAAARLLSAKLSRSGIDVKVDIWLESVCLKMQKRSWLNEQTTKPFRESVFFSVWVNEQTIQENILMYNIHALQMRQLKGYEIKSRAFAEAFRHEFLRHQKNWPHVSTSFGPLTLMEGWVRLDQGPLEQAVLQRWFFKLISLSEVLTIIIKKILDSANDSHGCFF
jgi:hypothetical protein